jgi:NTE family protein
MEPTLHAHLAGRRFGLVLSAGFFGFYGHAGFVSGLLAAGLRPAAWAGTSAGGLVAAYAAAGMAPGDLEALVLRQTRAHFWDPDPVGAVVGAARGWGLTGLLKGERFRALLTSTLPVPTFEALPSPLLLVATDVARGEPVALSSGPLAPAVHATCAYPGLFRAVDVGGRALWDGGLVDKAPALALADAAAAPGGTGAGPGAGLEALLVHLLPSRAQAAAGPFAYARAMAAGVAGLRREHLKLQLAVLAARGLPVYVVSSELPAVSPSRMERGREALEAARLSCARALAAPPPRPFAGG